MSYKWLNGYSTVLNDKLNAKDGLLPIDDAKNLAETLDSDHTYLTINDGTGAEIVKAYAFGNEVKIERGQDGTERKRKLSLWGLALSGRLQKQGLRKQSVMQTLNVLKS